MCALGGAGIRLWGMFFSKKMMLLLADSLHAGGGLFRGPGAGGEGKKKVFLVEAGHEDQGISRNVDWDTPLMAAVMCDGNNDPIVRLLIERFERGIPWQNKAGLDAVRVSLSLFLSDFVPLFPSFFSLSLDLSFEKHLYPY